MERAQTVIARGLARDAAADWKEHKKGCTQCSLYRRKCGRGRDLFTAYQDRAAELEHEKNLDEAPDPGQMALF